MKKQVVFLLCLTFVLVFLAPFPGDGVFRLIPSLNYVDLQQSESFSTGHYTGSIPVSWAEQGYPPGAGSIISPMALQVLSGYATEEKHDGSFITSPRSDRQLLEGSAMQYSCYGNRGTRGIIQHDNTLTMSCREPIEPARLAQNRNSYSPRLLPSEGSYPPVGEHSKKPIVMNNHDMPGPEINDNPPTPPGLTPSPSNLGGASSIKLDQSSDQSSCPGSIPHRSSGNGYGDSLRQHP